MSKLFNNLDKSNLKSPQLVKINLKYTQLW